MSASRAGAITEIFEKWIAQHEHTENIRNKPPYGRSVKVYHYGRVICETYHIWEDRDTSETFRANMSVHSNDAPQVDPLLYIMCWQKTRKEGFVSTVNICWPQQTRLHTVCLLGHVYEDCTRECGRCKQLQYVMFTLCKTAYAWESAADTCGLSRDTHGVVRGMLGKLAANLVWQ